MAKSNKKESIVEEIEEKIVETAKKVANKVEEVAEEVVEEVEELVEGKESKTKAKPKKSSETKVEKSEIDSKEDKKAKLAKLLEKAKKLEGKVEDSKDVDLKKKVKNEEDEKETMVPMEDYLKSSIHLGTRVITPDMRPYVYRRRADGLAVFNTSLLDDKIKEGAEYLAKFVPKDVILVCKREAGWKAVKKFSEITGMKCFTKKYPAGILTNTTLDNFMETELVFICDPWLDKNALEDANRIKAQVLSICDTNNYTQGITKIIPGNNKSAKSIGMILYLLARIYVEKHKINAPAFTIADFIEDWEKAEIPA